MNFENLSVDELKELFEKAKEQDENLLPLSKALIPLLFAYIDGYEEEKQMEYQNWLDDRDRYDDHE